MNGAKRAHRMLAKKPWVLLATALVAFPTGGQSAELGRMTVLSRAGEPLNAQIEVLSLAPGEERSLSARLAAPGTFRLSGIPYKPILDDVQISIERRRGRTFLRLKTTQPLTEPALPLILELNTGRDLQLSQYNVVLPPESPQPPGVAVAKPKPEAPPGDSPPSSREALFGVAPAAPGAPAPASAVQWRGFVQNTTAYDYREPKHWSRAVFRTQLGAHGGGTDFKWRATVRADVDPVYATSSFYPAEVKDDQRRDFFIRETYFDTSAAGLNLRVGKQNIVWGEMVGLFFADVVSARDQRDFILPDFEIIRIPQWAVRAEHFGDNSHAELVWLPVPEVDIIGKPGAEFYPFRAPAPPGFDQQFGAQQKPSRELKNSNLGLRASTLQSGWDLSAFYYRSTDVNPTFYRDVVLVPAPTAIFTPRHDRIWQVGGTLGKDLGFMVAKAEVIYTSGRSFNVTRLTEATGVVPQRTLDYVVGFDFTLPAETRLNLQYFGRAFREHDPDLFFERREEGVSLLISAKLWATLTPELLVISSLERKDRLVRTKLGWIPARNWQLTFGVDTFDGPPTGLFGRFADRDRVYVETRFDF